MFRGAVVSIHIAEAAALPMQQRSEVSAVAGKGIAGDRYFLGEGYYSNSRDVSRDITLVEIETIEALERKGILLQAGEVRRNLVTRDVPLNHLVGRIFLVGSVLLRGTKLCEPCAYLENLTQKGIMKQLIHRGGLRADIMGSGTIRVGDVITQE